MKKFILLVSAWLGLAATAIVHAQVESTPYAFTWKSTPDDNNPDDKTEIALPARFSMEGGASLVIYDDPEGFVLNEETKMLYADWSEFTNDAARLSISYTAEYTKDGEKVSIKRDNWDEWVNVWKNSNEYDLTNFSANSTNEESMGWIRKNYPDAKITITRICIRNFKDAGIVFEYGLESLNIAGQNVAVLPTKQESAKFYGGEFTVGKLGRQACNVGRFEIPEEYKGGYFRIDFGKEPENVWNLNLALKDAEENDVNSGVSDIDDCTKKVGLTRYYKIPEEAVTINPQLWKGLEDAEPWTVKVDGFYLTNGIDNSATYTDEYFPLTEEDVDITLFNDKNLNAFDTDTKQLSLGQAGAAGWKFGGARDFSDYQYAVVVLNEQAHDGLQFRLYNTDGGQQSETSLKGYYTVLNLDELKVGNTETPLEPARIYRAAFWAWGPGEGRATVHCLSHVFLTNTLPDWENPDARTTTADNYGTVCFEYPAVVSGAYIYTVEGKDAEGKTLYLKPYNGVLTAGVPYLYKAIGDEGVNFYQIKSEEAKSETPMTRNGLVGCLDETVGADAGGHALHSDNTWYKIDTDVQFTNRAYLKVADVPVMTEEEAVSANVNRMMLGDWDVTGINEVQAAAPQVDDEAVYNLSGIKMDADNLPKGIYIRGGKKFIVK